MLIAFAVAIAGASLLPPPIASPATLPRPPVAVDGGYEATIHFRLWEVNVDPERFALRVVTAMRQESCLFAEALPGGAVGYSETCRVAAFVVPYGYLRHECFLLTAGRSSDEARRLVEAIHDRVSKAPDDPAAPRVIGTRDPKREAELPALGWHVDVRSAVPISKHFANIAALVLEKRGCAVQTVASGMACGCRVEHRTMALAFNHADRLTNFYMVFTAAAKPETATETAKSVGTAVMKILFE